MTTPVTSLFAPARDATVRMTPRACCAASGLLLGCWLAGGCGAFSARSRRAHEPARCVQGKCAEGYSCHYEHERAGGTAQLSVCRPEVGRCNSNADCNPAQICFRDTARLGSCGQREY